MQQVLGILTLVRDAQLELQGRHSCFGEQLTTSPGPAVDFFSNNSAL
jgi:hypothetical protein